MYSESSSAQYKDGKWVSEEHAKHNIDGQTVLKKDVYNRDGHVTGKEITVDQTGQHIKSIGN